MTSKGYLQHYLVVLVNLDQSTSVGSA